MWNLVLIVVAVLVVLFVVIVATRPSDFRVTRTGRIAAPVELVFDNVNTLRKWEAWSPWAKLDPNAKSTFTGPESGPGSCMAWSGNKKVGEGRMTITDSQSPGMIHLKLEFLRPMQVTNTAEFLFKGDGDQTTVTWSMSGKNNFIGKAFHLVINCEKMVGRDFEKGLANLNAACQGMVRS